jgi:hypothetical protein
MRTNQQFILRIFVTSLLTIIVWKLGEKILGVSFDPGDVDLSVISIGWAVFIGLIWAILVGRPFVSWVGEFFATGLFFPEVSGKLEPQYSIPEARVKQGLYTEAIEEFRKYVELYPEEVTPHMRIADLQLKYFENPTEAIREISLAIPKAKTAESFAFVYFRMAELYWHEQKNGYAALECYR